MGKDESIVEPFANLTLPEKEALRKTLREEFDRVCEKKLKLNMQIFFHVHLYGKNQNPGQQSFLLCVYI